MLDNGNDHGRFTCAAGNHVAHDDDRAARVLRLQEADAVKPAPHTDQRAVHLRDRPQHPGERAACLPDFLEPGGGWGEGCAPQCGGAGRGRLQPGGSHACQRLGLRAAADDCVANVICTRPARRAAFQRGEADPRPRRRWRLPRALAHLTPGRVTSSGWAPPPRCRVRWRA